jgi:hypothetical protein
MQSPGKRGYLQAISLGHVVNFSSLDVVRLSPKVVAEVLRVTAKAGARSNKAYMMPAHFPF